MDSTRIKPDARRDYLMMTMLAGAQHLSDILAEFEYAPRHGLRFKLNDLLKYVIGLNSNQIATQPCEEVFHEWLRQVSLMSQGRFEVDRFMMDDEDQPQHPN